MDLALSDEQQMLATSASAFVERWCPPARVRQIAADPLGHDPELWRAMASLGWAGLPIADTHGGSGGGVLELAVLCEALGRGPVPSPIVVSTTLAALPIAWAGHDEQRDTWLPALSSGEAIGSLALVEPGGHDEWDEPGLHGGPALRGTKLLVPWAGTADVLLVDTVDGLHLVELRRGGTTSERHDDLGADPLFVVELCDAPAEPLGAGGREGHVPVLRRALDCAAVVQLAYVVGAAERALEMTVQHACDRHQFGRPIGSFQAVAHRCVDMRTDLDACRYLAYRAAWALDRGGPADLEVAAAKAYGNESLRRILVHAHQVHGAIGFSTEHDLHLFTRCAKSFELSYGSTTRHLDRVATTMGLG
ncbi:MAG: acyl-CoA/acyl-ACP dehydrogenase [Thermoleophilaceae bacterium]|nr:acyl-CoA/acyl-ACP dehydrogenase [Thermoleophilaceae bacterium]